MRTVATDGRTLYAAREVSLKDGVTLPTPLAAGDVRLGTPEQDFPETVRGINELHYGFTPQLLAKIKTQSDVDFVRGLAASARAGVQRGDINLVIPCIDAIPSKKLHVEYVADTAYVPADVLATPVLRDGRRHFEERAKTFDEYLAFVKAFLADVERLNHKTVLGTLPPLAYAKIGTLVDTYLAAGINGFCVDLGGRSPSLEHQRNLRPLLKRLADQGLAEQSFLYALNAQSGRPGRQSKPGVAPAQDILSWGFGFDAIGLRRMSRRMGNAAEEAEKKKAPQFRFFDRKAYAYRTVGLNQAGKALPDKSTIALVGIKDEKRRIKLQKMVSIEQRAIEAHELRTAIIESRLGDHLKQKSELESESQAALRSARAQTTLEW